MVNVNYPFVDRIDSTECVPCTVNSDESIVTAIAPFCFGLKQVRIHDKTSRVLLGRGSNAQKLLKAQEKLKKVNGGRTDRRTDRQSDL